MSYAPSEEERIQAMALSLEEELTIAFPDGPNNDNINKEEKIRSSLIHMVKEIHRPDEHEILKQAFPIALQNWKSKTSKAMMTKVEDPITTTKPTTFSLFDQLDGIGGFGQPVSLEEIQDAPSVEARLEIYKKMVYLEDLSIDWNEISPLLVQDLLESSEEHVFEIIKLHRKWFDQGRSSSEYTPLLYSLCQNMIETIVGEVLRSGKTKTSDMDKEKRSIMVTLVQNWRDMWLDLMTRDQYSVDLAQEMEVCMLVLFLRHPPTEVCRLFQEILAFLDPCARWFHGWADHFGSNQRLLYLMKVQTKILPDLRIRVQTRPDSADIPSLALFFHSLSVVAVTTSRFRLSQFPWNEFYESYQEEFKLDDLANWKKAINISSTIQDPTPVNESFDNFDASSIDQMLNIFLSAARLLPNNTSSKQLKFVFFNAIDVILSGCKAGGFGFSERCGHVASTLQFMAASGDTAACFLLESLTLHNARGTI
jgi:hypothetical protein